MDNNDIIHLPEDNPSEDDEELLDARRKEMRYRKCQTLLEESDGEKEYNTDSNDESIDESNEDEGETMLIEDHESSDRVNSDYISSSDPGSYRESTDEDPEIKDDAIRKKSRFRKYKKTTVGVPDFEVGMLFNNNKEFKEAVISLGVLTRTDIRFVKNEPKRCRVKCFGSVDCPWLLFASVNNSVDSFQVKTYINKHTCQPKRVLKRVTAKVLANKFHDVITAHPDIKTKYLKAIVKKTMEIEVTTGQCRRAKNRVLTELMGDCAEEYRQLRDYGEELMRSNPGTTVAILTNRQQPDSQAVFQGFYVCFNSCKHGLLAGCRPVLGIDGCFLKGLVKGELLTAIGRDGNNQMFPVAWAVVEVENTESWIWFLRLIRQDLGIVDGGGWTILSDRQKGLVAAVSMIWPKAEHRFCCRHMYANWSKEHKGREFKNQFWSLAKATNKASFDRRFKELEKLDDKAAKDLLKTDPKFWCKAFFSSHSKCDSVDNNLCEAFNGTIVEARSKSIISMLNDIRIAVMKRFRDKNKFATKWNTDIGPRLKEKFDKNVKDSLAWECEWNGVGSYEVKFRKAQYVVKLNEHECSCGSWVLNGIPCPHAISAIYDNGQKPEDYISHWYKRETYLKAYELPLQPINGVDQWYKSSLDHVEPPKMRNMPGRPKKKRRKEMDEIQVKERFTREGRNMTCKVCKGKGHNSRNTKCPGKASSSGTTEHISGNQKSRITNATQESQVKSSSPANSSQIVVVTQGSQAGTSSTTISNYISSHHKECRPKSKPRKKVPLYGLGVYVNPESGRTILNPGTSMSRVIDHGKNKLKKIVPPQ